METRNYPPLGDLPKGEKLETKIGIMEKKPKIYYVRWVLPPYRAMTIPPFGIFIKNKYRDNKKILNHDLVHWQQYCEKGLLKFYGQYFRQFLKYGYNRMPMEIEARYEENEYIKTHYSE